MGNMDVPEIRPRRGGKASYIDHASEAYHGAAVFGAHDEKCESEFTVARGRYAYTDCGCRDRWVSERHIPAEVEADADTAFELGRVAGYDEARREMQPLVVGVKSLIYDLKGTREDGTVLTAGYLIHLLSSALTSAQIEPSIPVPGDKVDGHASSDGES